MEQTTSILASLAELLDASNRPVYAVDAQRRIVYLNAALAEWVGHNTEQIVGRPVEYHSETATDGAASRGSPAPLPDLCPPPTALAGMQCVGTIGCVARGGRLVHRQADFIPLGGETVLVVLAAADMSAQDLAAGLSPEPTVDELHRAIRRFRRNQAAEYAIESLLGDSSVMRRVRAQVAAAATSQANVLVRGRSGTGRAHVARAIHYQAPAEAVGKLVPFDCEVAGEDHFRRAVDAVQHADDKRRRATLLLLDLERLTPTLQSRLLATVQDTAFRGRLIATASADTAVVTPELLNLVSTMTVDVPRLVERLEDLPLLVQHFVEAANQGVAKQVGSVQSEVLDLLSLYSWPGELDELRSVIASAHAACEAHEIAPRDLPTVIHHAAQAASMPRRTQEKIVLDDLLASIEREVIGRAMKQAGGNKSAAAELLGMTRPRLYRRLVHLGLVENSEAARPESGSPPE